MVLIVDTRFNNLNVCYIKGWSKVIKLFFDLIYYNIIFENEPTRHINYQNVT